MLQTVNLSMPLTLAGNSAACLNIVLPISMPELNGENCSLNGTILQDEMATGLEFEFDALVSKDFSRA